MQRWGGQERALHGGEASPVVELATEHRWREQPEQRVEAGMARLCGAGLRARLTM